MNIRRLSNFTLRQKLKYEESTFIAVLHFTVTTGLHQPTISNTHTLNWAWNDSFNYNVDCFLLNYLSCYISTTCLFVTGNSNHIEKIEVHPQKRQQKTETNYKKMYR
jgi:hypothetical protein